MYQQMYKVKSLVHIPHLMRVYVTTRHLTYSELMDFVDSISSFSGTDPVHSLFSRRAHWVEKLNWSWRSPAGRPFNRTMYITKSHFADVR